MKRTRSQANIVHVLKSLNHPISAQDLHREMKHRDLRLGLATVSLSQFGSIKARR